MPAFLPQWLARTALLTCLLTVPLNVLAPVQAQPSPTGVPQQLTIPRRNLRPDELGIGPIRLGMAEAEVLRLLGKPRQVKQEQTAVVGLLKTLTYTDLTVGLMEGEKGFRVYQVISRTIRPATVHGIRVGDGRSKVITTYGTPNRSSREQGFTNLIYMQDAMATYLNFRLKGDRVVQITAGELLN